MKLNVADNSKMEQIIRSIEIGMLTTVQENGELRSRPMLCADYVFETLWFLVKESKPLIAESLSNRIVNVAFASPEKKIYASVTGLAQLVEDNKLVRKLWRPEMTSWFPAGLNEPDLALLRIDIQHAEAWDSDNL